MEFLAYFIKSNYAILYKSVEVLAALTGIFLLRKYKQDLAAKLFIFFLIYVNLIETIGSYPRLIKKNEDGIMIFDNNNYLISNDKYHLTIHGINYLGKNIINEINFLREKQ